MSARGQPLQGFCLPRSQVQITHSYLDRVLATRFFLDIGFESDNMKLNKIIMKIVKDSIRIEELRQMAEKMFGEMVKAMADVEKGILAVDAPLHADLAELLIEKENSESKNLWGINIHPDKTEDDYIEFDSMMNLKPGMGNKTRGVENPDIRQKIIDIVNKLVAK